MNIPADLALPVAFSEESIGNRWLRRAVTLPSYLGLALIVGSALPLLALLTSSVDVVRRRR